MEAGSIFSIKVEILSTLLSLQIFNRQVQFRWDKEKIYFTASGEKHGGSERFPNNDIAAVSLERLTMALWTASRGVGLLLHRW